jgi:hypothetical protein
VNAHAGGRPDAGRRARIPHVVLALGTIVCGLAVHGGGRGLPPTLRDVLGDALWAAMLAWWVGALAPAWPVRGRAAAAYALCVAVELSQRVHTPALDALRATTPGHLVLGSDYDARDLAAYALGVVAAAALEVGLRRAGRWPTRAAPSTAGAPGDGGVRAHLRAPG